MKCPICNVDLVMSDRQGIEIDYCPECRGIWLDRGELDKIIEKSSTVSERAPEPSYKEDYRRDDHNHKQEYQKKHKKESWIGEIFDF